MAEPVICPHCAQGVGMEWPSYISSMGDADELPSGSWWIRAGNCPLCGGLLVIKAHYVGSSPEGFVFDEQHLIYPAHAAIAPLPPEVDASYVADFVEAAHVLPASAKASAALSRRLLQRTLRGKGGIGPKRSLEAEIDAAIESGGLPSGLADDLHAVRTVGNFAAHPLKDTETGAIVDVEPGEAQWLLELLRDLFDFYFVAPARREARRLALNEKLRGAGKPELAES